MITSQQFQSAWAMRARIAIAAVFFLNGFVLASWVPHIPAVQMALGLNEAALGVALLGMAVGALGAIPLTGWAIPRLGSRLVVRVSAVAFCDTLLGPMLAPTLPLLFAALVVFGACNGAMDVSMNAQAAALERIARRPIMSSFHGMWSVGGLLARGIRRIALHAGWSTAGARQRAPRSAAWRPSGVALRPLLPPPRTRRRAGRAWPAPPESC